MPLEVLYGRLIPLTGTTLGAACVFLMQGELSRTVERSLQGFAAGVMVAASIWSLLQPAMNGSASLWGALPSCPPLWASGSALFSCSCSTR